MGNPIRNLTKIEYTKYYNVLVIYILLLFPFMSFSGMELFLGENTSIAYQALAAVLLGLMVLTKTRKIKINSFVLLYMAFQFLLLIVTAANDRLTIGMVASAFVGVFLILLMQNDAQIIIRALSIIAVIAVVINVICIFALDQSEGVLYFIGGKNSFSIYMIPASFVVVANDMIRKGKGSRWTMLFVALTVFSIFWGGSATGIVAVIAMILALLWYRKRGVKKWLCLLVVIGVYVAVAFFAKILSQTNWWFRLVTWLGKDVTLTSRLSIWEAVINIVKENWFAGVGRGAEIHYRSSWGGRVISGEAHNFLLEILLEGGVLGIVFYGSVFWNAMRRLNMESRLHRLLFLGFMVVLINGLAESINNRLILNLMLSIAHTCANKGIYEKGWIKPAEEE